MHAWGSQDDGRIIIGGVEAGGTKFNCVLAESPECILERATFATTTPQQTLEAVIAFFRAGEQRHGRLQALGIASFGPVELDPATPAFGHITQTPKPHWSHVPILPRLREALAVPVAFETDVNGAALGEQLGGAAAGLTDFAYVTVGTGIGAGLVSAGRLVHGVSHPEIGHMLLPRHPEDTYSGYCGFHGHCLEGLASGPALQERWDLNAHSLPEDHPAWRIQAYYLAAMCHNLTCLTAPQRIILGGGVMQRSHLYDLTRQQFLQMAGGYFPWISHATVSRYIVAPGHGDRAGEIGALILAQRILNAG